MKQMGIILIILGITAIAFAINKETTVIVDKPQQQYGISYTLPEKVNNIGLMNDKQNTIILGGIGLIAGLILFVGSGMQINKINTEEESEEIEIREETSSSPLS